MVKSKYKTALVGFYQITNSYNGASEVSQSLFESIKTKKNYLSYRIHLYLIMKANFQILLIPIFLNQ